MGISVPERRRQMAHAKRLQDAGLTRAEIAEEMGISFDAVKRRLRGARKREQLDPEIVSELDRHGFSDLSGLKRGWILRKDDSGSGGSLYFDLGNESEARQVEEIIADACRELADRSPVVAKPDYDLGDHMLVISPADIHMGKLAEAYESNDTYTKETAEQRTKEGVAALLQVNKLYRLECITINTGNDSLHVDNRSNTTTRGTPQDTDGSIFGMFQAMMDTWIWVIEQSAAVAPVHVVFDPSNHPMVSDWMLNQALQAWFRNDERVTFDVNMQSMLHRKYQVYGASLIGYAHGNAVKEKDLPQLMQYEAREWWGKVKRGYWIIKHTHHKNAKMVGMSPYQVEKDYAGVTVIRSGNMNGDENIAVEVVRSPSGTDFYHHSHGYVGALKAVEAYVFSFERGQVARFTHPFY